MKNTEQILPGLAVQPEPKPASLKPASGRAEPALWISKLAVHKDWPPTKETLLKQVFELRRGLNILWAQPNGSTPEASKLGGHSAGKTTFCRLIRYVLGEEPAGTKAFREGFNSQFHNGWVLAEVYVAGKRWLVGRPLSHTGYHSFAKLGGSLTDEFSTSPSRQGFKDEFLPAVDAAVFGGMTFRTLADSQKNLDWQQLLPWLSRDQEAHFSGLLDWRHKPDSDSDSPNPSAEDKANLIRLILGLVDEKEQDLLSQFAKKAQLHEQKVRDRPKLEFAIERQRLTLEIVLGIKVETPDAPLLQKTVDDRVSLLRKATDQALASVKQNAEIDLLIKEFSNRQAEWGIANAFTEELSEAIEIAEARAKGIKPPTPKLLPRDPYREALKNMGPFPGYCSHPMDKAWDAGCPIASERPREDAITSATKKISSESKPEALRIAAMKTELARRQKLAAPKKIALDAAEKSLKEARECHRKQLEALKAPAQEAASIEAVLKSYRVACTDLVTWDSELNDLKGDKEKLEAQLAELTQLHDKLIEDFGIIFNHVAQRMLGAVVTGSVRIKGKAIFPELEYHGPRDSAALKVVRWLIFDLAALALGITNAAAHHPRFLLHDSPRESDLAAEIYVSLFTAAEELEDGSSDSAPFQYIVTTTEAPPESVRKKPWMVATLDASSETGRLLGIDL